jgi:hypothetical protein
MKISVTIFTAFVLITSCSTKKSHSSDEESSASKSCTFTNPVGKGQDPWVIKKDGYYYL